MRMDNLIKLADDKTLCLFDSSNRLVVTYKSRWTKFKEFRRVGHNCIIVRESDEKFADNSGHANIYCLDDTFQLVWTIDAPFKNDSFPNAIVWNKQIIRRQKSDGYLTLETIDNPKTFMCSSWHGFTVTVDYESGQTISSEFTK
jgi:hypothetical protein